MLIGARERKIPRPEKPGFYEMVLNGSKYTYRKYPTDKIGSELRKVKGSEDFTAWDFRLLVDSLQAQNNLSSGSCGDSYVLTATDIAGVAAYINSFNSSESFNRIISVNYELACEDCIEFEGEEFCQNGCNGGYPQGVLKYILDRGIVTKDCVSSSQDSCPENCSNGSPIELYKDSQFSIVVAFNEKVSFLRDLITSSGPCIAEMYVHQNFFFYTGDGVYKRPDGSEGEEGHFNHAVLVYGFGVEDGQPYWLGKNVWGGEWGLKGYFRIELGKNDSGFEEIFMCINNNIEKGPYKVVPIPPQPEFDWTKIDGSDNNTDNDGEGEGEGGPDGQSGPANSTNPTPSSLTKGQIAAAITVPVVVTVVAVAVAIVVVVTVRKRNRGQQEGGRRNLDLGSEATNVGNQGGAELGSGPRLGVVQPFVDRVDDDGVEGGGGESAESTTVVPSQTRQPFRDQEEEQV